MTKKELEKEAEEYALKQWEGQIPWGVIQKSYYDGAEPREKRIEELEAEVKEWKDKADLWCKTANLKDHNIMINKELEKENAELKEKYVKNITDCDICDTYCNSQLTKAKEIIKDLLGSENTSCEEEMFFEIRQKAEQFLSEVEK